MSASVHLTDLSGNIIASTIIDDVLNFQLEAGATALDGLSFVRVYAARDSDADGIIEVGDDVGGYYGAPDDVAVSSSPSETTGLDIVVPESYLE